MHRPVQWKFAAKAAHGPRGEQGERPPLLDCAWGGKEIWPLARPCPGGST